MSESGVLASLVEELRSNPAGAIELMQAVASVVRPWERVDIEDGLSRASLVYRRTTVMGEEVARIEQNYPTWFISVCGESIRSTRVFNTRTALEEAQDICNDTLISRGYVLM